MSKTKTNTVTKFHYLQDRPFLVVKGYIRPKKDVKTENAGWSKDRENIDVHEEPSISYHISDKIMREASVIVDITNNTLVKNRYRRASNEVSPEMLDDKILKHFRSKYSQYFSGFKK